MSDELKHLLFKLIQANSYSSEKNFIKLHNEFCQAIDALLARAERAEADLAMAEARCSFLHNENKRLDGLVVERGRMVERLIETGNKIHNVLPDVNVGSRIDRNWQALVAGWSKEHDNE